MSDMTDEETFNIKKVKFKDMRERIFLASALEDSIKQTFILASCHNTHENKTDNLNIKKSGLSPKKGIDDVNETLPSNKKYAHAKMNNDREFIMESLINTYLDVTLNGKFKMLLTLLSDLSTKKYKNIIQDMKIDENHSKALSLEKELKNETALHKNMIKNCDIQIKKLLDEIDDEVWNCSIKKDYAAEWASSKLDQFVLNIKMREGEMTKNMERAKQEIEDEAEISYQIVKFTNFVTQDLISQVQYWIKRYNQEYQSYDVEIEKMTAVCQEQLQKIGALQHLLVEHKKEMDEWCNFVEERRKARELAVLRERSALRIQRWWRRICERRRLDEKLAKDKKKKKK